MKNISEFFKKIGGIHAKEMALRASIQAAIKRYVDVDVPAGMIQVKSGTVTFKGLSHGARSVIFIHKKEIIEAIRAAQPETAIVDIR